MRSPKAWHNPPREFSVLPFWFWNDELAEEEIVRQIADFENHGVYGFIIHPRIGLPRSIEWMSNKLLGFYRVAIEEASRRNMYVVLYDEGMYPSGSSCGQVVFANPDFHCRCLSVVKTRANHEPPLSEDQTLVSVVKNSDGQWIAVIDRKADSYLRGIHYIGDGGTEEEPPAADILNPDAVAEFIRLVYDRFAEHFSEYFGKTIVAVFNDESNPLSKCREIDVQPGTTGIIKHINRILGYDFEPHLAALWYDAEPEAQHFRNEYKRAIKLRLEETYYSQINAWCEKHGLPLTGHPHEADDIGILRYFHIPGQDSVWRLVLPDHSSALEGRESTQAKCSSSSMVHLGRRRNSNEYCGAYGHELTWDEMNWLASWCFVRGVNLLYPHAFYYSVRGPRIDERPPDVGPNSAWWDKYGIHAEGCRRLCWLNTDSEHVCSVAVLGQSNFLPWQGAKVCFEHQRDFNYLEERHLLEDAVVDSGGIRIAGMHYLVLIVDCEHSADVTSAFAALECTGRLIRMNTGMSDSELINRIDSLVQPDVVVSPESKGLRIRHVVKEESDFYILFNETADDINVQIDTSVTGERVLLDPNTGREKIIDADSLIYVEGHSLYVLMITSTDVMPATNAEVT